MTPTWLVDESGRVVAGYAADYLVRLGRVRDEEQLARDRADAFANVAPSFDQNSDGERLARVPGGFETTAPEHRCLNVGLRVALDLEDDEFRVWADLDDRRLRPSAIGELAGVADDFTVECLAVEGMNPLGIVGAGAARRFPYFHIRAVRED